MKILFTGGGSGGHIFPIMAVIRELKKIPPYDEENPEQRIFYYLGASDKSRAALLLKREGVKVKLIMSGKLRRSFNPAAILLNIFDILIRIPLGTMQAFVYLFFWAPDLIFSKGGYGSLPTVIAGWLLQIPVILHESDIVVGFANRFMAKMAIEVFASFQNTEGLPKDKILVVGNPVRRELLEGSLEEGKKIFQLTGEKPVVLILGGSQGASRINDLVLNIIREWVENFEIIHQTGSQSQKSVVRESQVILGENKKLYYHAFGFLEEEQLKHAYAACHFIVSRAGSGIIFEIAALAKPSLLIPLPEAAQNHQLKNAYSLADMGGAIVVEHANLTPHFLLEKIKYIFSHPEEYQKMALKARDFSKPKAGRIIAEYIYAYLTYA